MATETFYVEEFRRAKDAIIHLGGMALTLIMAIGVGALFEDSLKVHESVQKQIPLGVGLSGFCLYYVVRVMRYRTTLLHCSRKLEAMGFASAEELSALGMSRDDITRFTGLIVAVPVVIIAVIGTSLILE